MALHLPDKWVWDFWFAIAGDDIHVFYLQADRALKEDHLRHWHVSIGHAVSQDLVHWDVLEDALKPSEYDGFSNEPFDHYTTWTGSIIQHHGLWYMFYTGGKKSEKALVQRIGLATSRDLLTWEKHPDNPLIEADPTWYELLDLNVWHDQAWRDPFVFLDPATETFHAFITARAKSGVPDARGVIGHATSSDLLRWEVQAPVPVPDLFGYYEVPQLIQTNGRFYLIFSCPYAYYSKKHQHNFEPQTAPAIHYLIADQLTGPYTYGGGLKISTFGETLYSGKLIQFKGQWYLVGFQNLTETRDFLGDLSDPIPVTFGIDSRIDVADT